MAELTAAVENAAEWRVSGHRQCTNGTHIYTCTQTHSHCSMGSGGPMAGIVRTEGN